MCTSALSRSDEVTLMVCLRTVNTRSPSPKTRSSGAFSPLKESPPCCARPHGPPCWSLNQLCAHGHLPLHLLLALLWWCCAAHGILVPRPEIEPMPPALEAWSLNHRTAMQVPLPFALNALPQIHTCWFLFITEHSAQMVGALHEHKVGGPPPLHPCL